MKNKNTATKRNLKLIANIKEMLVSMKPVVQKDPAYWASWEQSWKELLGTLEAGGSI
jgi:hypothetical protein